MTAKRYRDIKKEFPIEEGKLVSDFESILGKIMSDLKSKLGKEYKKNSEKGIAMINTIGAMVGAKVTDKKQTKGKLFLKFGDPLELELDERMYTNVHNKIKKIKNLKRADAKAIAMIDPFVLGKVVKALMPMYEAKKDMTAISSWKKKLKQVKGLTKQQLQILSTLPTPVITSLINQVGMVVAGDIQEDAAVDAANLKARQAEEMERLKEKHLQEMEALKERHERQMKAIDLQKEKETANKQIESEREAARKKAQNESLEEAGLWDNIRAKKARGEKMRKKGEKGAPTDDQIKRAKGEEVQEKAPDTEDAMKRHKAGKAGFGDITHLKAKGLIPRADGTKKKSPKYEDKEEQDKDVGDKKGTQPKKYYKGLDKKTKEKRDAHFKKGLTGPAPGDKTDDGKQTKTKKSTHTKKFAKMYGEKLTAKSDAGDYIDDFRKSDAPQFKGKSDKKIRKMAIAAYLDKKGK